MFYLTYNNTASANQTTVKLIGRRIINNYLWRIFHPMLIYSLLNHTPLPTVSLYIASHLQLVSHLLVLTL